MSRRKQTKPFKVEDKVDLKRDKKRSLRNILSKTEERVQHSSPQSDLNGAHESDKDVTVESDPGKRSKRGNKCNQCGKILASTLSLARHKLTHSANKPFECPKCGTGFKTSSNMHRHLRIHFREKELEERREVGKEPRGTNQRTPRQNIRTPTKFKEFDVDLVGVNPRPTSDGHVTNARSYSKPKETLMKRKQTSGGLKRDTDRKSSQMEDEDNFDGYEESDDVQDLSSWRKRGVSESSKTSTAKQEDLICHVCNKSFISKFGLITHAITHPEPLDQNKCFLCEQRFTTPRGLAVHNVIVHKISEYKEIPSLKQAKNERGFKDMALIDFSANKFAIVAEATCTQIQRNQSHRDTQHIFVCKKCDKAFPSLDALNLHMENIHWKLPEKVAQSDELQDFLASLNLYKKVDVALKVKSSDKKHKKIVNGIDDDFIYTSDSAAIKNMSPWMQENSDLTNTNYLKESDVKFTRPKLRHIRRKDPATAIAIQSSKQLNNASDNSVKTREIAKRRSRNFVDGEEIESTIDVVKQNDLDKNGERNVFWCRICNYSSHEKSALVRHLLTHSGIRPYFCKICDYAFTTKANCERHVRKRHNCIERRQLNDAVRCDWEMLKKAPRDDIYMISGSNSSCPVCSKSFSCNNDLKQHLKQHEERQFVCQLCNVRCTTRNNCVRHILHKHPGIPHQEANNIISFVGTGKNQDIQMNKILDDTKEKMTIDISRGCLGGRKASKRLPPPLVKARSKHPSSEITHAEQPSLKKRRLSIRKDTEITSSSQETDNIVNADDRHSNIPMSLPEDELENENIQASRRRATKYLPLIPLLKIKAYSEAAMRSYADMVSLYQNLNFFNNSSNRVDGNIIPMLQSPVKQESVDMITSRETAFICRSCSGTFHTEEELNHHIVACSSNDADADDTMHDDYAEMFDPDQHYDSSNWRNDDLFVNTDMQVAANDWTTSPNNNITEETALTPEWAHTNSFTDSPMKQIDSSSGVEDIADLSQDRNSMLQIKAFENNQTVEQWIDGNTAAELSYSTKSMEATVPQDYDHEFGAEVPRVFASHAGKESNYIEDSLLLSMFSDGKKDYENENDNQSSIVPRYSASFPTMVNMESPTMTRIKNQNRGPLSSSSDKTDEKVVPGRGRYSVRKCPQCDKTFPWASSLRRHIMTHTGLKLYMCRVCKMRFTTRSNLIRHVYRRHGMAKQHPDFSSCLAKLHPSDTLLKEVEADVRRRVDGTKKRSPLADEITAGTDNDNASNLDDEELQRGMNGLKKKKGVTNDFQSMLEEDPETLLVDLDYFPRDELNPFENKKTKSPLTKSPKKKTTNPQPDQSTTQITSVDDSVIMDEMNETEEQKDLPIDMTTTIPPLKDQSFAEDLQKVEDQLHVEPHYHRGKNLRRRSESKSIPTPKNSPSKTSTPTNGKEVKKEQITQSSVNTKVKLRNKQSTQFVCGLCKKIFKTVPDLISHLDTHDVPHSWHCPVCGVPFTNKYNCQRHLTRRHGRADTEPTYVEDLKHGPRTARGHPRKTVPDEQ